MAFNAQMGFDPDLDYSSAIQKIQAINAYSSLNAQNQADLKKLYAERQSKLDYMGTQGTLNTNWATNKDIYDWSSNVNQNNKMWVSENPKGYYVNYTPDPYANLITNYNTQQNNAYSAQNKWRTDYQSQQDATFNAYASDLERQRQSAEDAQKAAILASVERGKSQLSGQKSGINQSADELARQAYIMKMQTQNTLPQVLAAQGQSGGATESANIALGATYGNQVNSINQQKANQLKEIDDAINQLVISGDISIAEAAAKRAELGIQDTKDVFGQRLGQSNWLEELGMSKEQQAYGNLRADLGLNMDIINAQQAYRQSGEAMGLEREKFDYGKTQDALSRTDKTTQQAIENAYRDTIRQDTLAQNATDNAYRDIVRQDTLTQQTITNALNQANLEHGIKMDLQKFDEGIRQFNSNFGEEQRQFNATLSAREREMQNDNYWKGVSQSNWGKQFAQSVKESDAKMANDIFDRNLKEIVTNQQLSNDVKAAAIADTKAKMDYALNAAEFGDYRPLQQLGINPYGLSDVGSPRRDMFTDQNVKDVYDSFMERRSAVSESELMKKADELKRQGASDDEIYKLFQVFGYGY